MLDGWRAQMLARGLGVPFIQSSCSLVARFQEHSNEYPWAWQPIHVDEFLADRRTGPKGVSVSTLRANAGTIRAFCYYVTDERYGWAAFCSKAFDDIPAQVVRHSYVTHLLEAGYDPMFVQQQVGHAYASTTALYTSVSSDFKQKVVQQMIQQRIVTRDERNAGKDT